MASLRVLAFDHDGRLIQFDTWLDDLQLYLLSDSRDSVSLFDIASCIAPAPPALADSATRSQRLTRDAAARLAIHNHLPLVECAHFRQHRTAHALYDAVVACYSSPATAAIGRLLLLYLFPELSAFATVEDLVSHLRTSDTRYRAAASAEDHFLSLDPTNLTIDLLEQHLLVAETGVVAVGAARGTPRTPFFEGCPPSPLAPFYTFAAAVNVPGTEDVGAASANAKCRNDKGKGAKSGGGGSGSGGGGSGGGGGGSGGGGSSGSGDGSGGFGGSGGGSGGSGGSGGGGRGGGRTGARSGGQRQQQQRRMYALSASAEGGCYRCVPPYLDIGAAALGACESALPGTAPAEALHTFTLDSGASRCFLRDSTTLTPLPVPVPVRLADPSGGPVVARSSTVLSCPADAMVTTTTPGGQRVSICTCTRMGPHLATFTRRPGSSLYPLATEPPQVAAFAQVSASGKVAPPYSCRLLSHKTLLWHHRLGHPSLPRLRGMHSRLLVSGLPRSLPPLPPSPAPPCLVSRGGSAPLLTPPRFPRRLLPCSLFTWTCGAQPASLDRAASVTFCWLLTTTRSVSSSASGSARTFLSCICTLTEVVCSRPTCPLCHGEGILQPFTLPDSPQQNGIAERRIGLVMEVARTSMIHAAAPHFLWQFAVRYAAHQLNLWPRVSLPDTSPALRWTGKVVDASVFRVWVSRAFVRDTSADKLSARAIPYVFLGFVPDAHGWQFYHPTSRRVLPSHDVTFDESVPFYRLFPYRSAPLPPPPLFLTPGPPPVDPLPPQGPAPSGVSQVDPPLGTVPSEVAVDSGAARGAASGGAEPGGAETGGVEPGGAATGGAVPAGTESGDAEPGVAESGGAEPGGAEPEGVEPEGAESGGAEPGGAEPEGAEPGGAVPGGTSSSRGPAGVSPRLTPRPEPLSPLFLLVLITPHFGYEGAGPTGPGGARTGGAGAPGAGRAGGAGAGGTGAGAAGAGVAAGVGAGGAVAGTVGGTGVAGAGGAIGVGAGGAGPGGAGSGDSGRPRPYFVPLI
ncbi:unnamed protein product [Closterium sp. NIES-53]